jgi:uncharacterized protein (TIGR03067 family)
MKRACAVLGVAAVLVAAAGAEDKGATKLEGDYVLVSAEKNGQPVPDERVRGSMVRFTENRIVATDKDKKETYVASYKVDSSGKPCKIAMTSEIAPTQGVSTKGLVEQDGESIRLIYALPGGDEPTEFKTKDKQLMVVLKKKGKVSD